MSGPDAMRGEMPGFPPGRPGGERDEPLLDMIFDRRPIPAGAPPEMHDLARMLAAAAGPAEPGDLAGEAAALAAFARPVSPASVSPAAMRPARRWLSGRPARARLPLAAALVTAAAGLGSITAAYVGVLPGPIQQMAHVTVRAPAPPRNESRRPPAVIKARSSATPDLRTVTPRATHSSGPTPVPGTSSSPEPRLGRPRRSPGPVWATCTPIPGLTHTPPRPGPSPSPSPSPLEPGVPSWNPRFPVPANCLNIATQTAVPRPSL
jgi:hypothetical protein